MHISQEKIKKNIHVPRKGFSLIELLIVIFILTMSIGITLVSYRDATQVDKVEAAARKIAAAIREAQNSALTGRQAENASGTELEAVCSYGVSFVSGTTDEIKPFFERKNPTCPGTNIEIIGRKLEFNSDSDINVISSQSSISFSIPSGKVSSSVLITISSISNSNVKAYICMSSSGSVREFLGVTSVPTCN